MKKAIAILCTLAACIVLAVDLPRVNYQSFKAGQTRVLNNVITQTETSLNAAVIVDTNVTTTTTSYTPVEVGQLLVGGAGSGTNALWCATGTTTNDWAQLSSYAE